MTNGNDQVHEQTWVARHDGVPELNTNPKGLTKREYFAAMAMQGLWQSTTDQNYDKYHVIADMAVKQADALIHALNEKP